MRRDIKGEAQDHPLQIETGSGYTPVKLCNAVIVIQLFIVCMVGKSL